MPNIGAYSMTMLAVKLADRFILRSPLSFSLVSLPTYMHTKQGNNPRTAHFDGDDDVDDELCDARVRNMCSDATASVFSGWPL